MLDISTPLDQQTPVYPGDPPFVRRVDACLGADGTGYNLSSIHMSAHCGTHVDAPFHFFEHGLKIHEIPVERWVSRAIVIEVESKDLVTAAMLTEYELREDDAVLLKANSALPSNAGEFTALSLDAAEYLVSKRIHLVGIDALSIELYHDPVFPVHRKLLGNGILILEGLRLDHVRPGRYTLIVAPLLISDAEGAPARAMLKE